MLRAVDHAAACTALTAEITRFADLVRGQDLSRPVPTCPGWTLDTLIRHTGGVHRWAAAMVEQRSQTRLDRSAMDMGEPADPADLPDWLAAGADLLGRALAGTDPDTPMWAFSADKRMKFWSRRQLHETTVHRADAALALGVEPVIAAEVAVDGIDENLDNLPFTTYFAPHVANLKGNGETIHFHATDTDSGEWMITLTPEGFTYTHGHGKGDVAVRGTAGDLLLLVTRRRPPTDARYQVFGDAARLTFWLDNAAL